MTDFITLNANKMNPVDVERVVAHLREGHVIAYPTETIYGLGADVLNRAAIKNIYKLKARDPGLPISLLVSDLSMLRDFVSEVSDQALELIKTFWPGPLTILFPASPRIPKDLITNTGRIGIRISSHPVATAIVSAFGNPITTTSANLSGYPPSLDAKQVLKYFDQKLACIVDGGECEPNLGSTVVDVTKESMRIIREGAIPAQEVIQCFQG
ncbi:MAG: threonylcarbamoyl-AMP synthase [Deltaproteobacteria bacterium CG_4_10_14_0_2_um_filter_43_8]|nr:MAG: threonylcarbamoyl-AMP synthase [Deltaproteobacteria bacterium CG11_big_fil_rev_8_21_14_0_20_42_23]PJA22405.1 MAG: threonylcarbamoyl-AMP synthase [Deltaproteobacteria bacterium CG_4_10_14_0_2_um_filter_43_8]PJC64226.1 MAG: threonylcarbamoyl-AMP synthase [Deltaproteobacteria bacterium CG_4_9_14_0_2_um_filter_42_21]